HPSSPPKSPPTDRAESIEERRAQALLGVELAHDDVDQTVERVAKRPRLRGGILQRVRLLATGGEGALRPGATGAELPLRVDRGAFVDVEARGEVAAVEERSADVDRVTDHHGE